MSDDMDVIKSLDELANVLSELSARPYDVSVHRHHIELTELIGGEEADPQGAREMMINFIAAGDEVWLPFLAAKRSAVNLASASDVVGMLSSYERAEEDYLSIPILKEHLNFLFEQYSRYSSGGETRPEEFVDMFTTAWTRNAIARVVEKGLCHLTQSHLIWEMRRDWELEVLAVAPRAEREDLIELVQSLHLLRLKQPHANSEETGQSYSSFTTSYKSPHEYESLLIQASKVKAQAIKSYSRRDSWEMRLSQSGFSLDAYAQYIASEKRAKSPDIFILRGIYERAIAEAAKRRFKGEGNSEIALRAFWTGYLDVLRTEDEVTEEEEYQVYRRALRSVPGAGVIWSRYLRFLERMASAPVPPENMESISDAYDRAMVNKSITTDVEQLVTVTLARASYENRQVFSEKAGDDGVTNLLTVLESSIELIHLASKTGDPKLRLQKFLANFYESNNMVENAIETWKAATKHYKSSYQVWLSLTELLVRDLQYDTARQTYVDIHRKQLDWPEVIWEAWILFEQAHGTVATIDDCLDKVEKAQAQLDARRYKEAQQMQYQYQQMTTTQDTAPETSATVATDASVDAFINAAVAGVSAVHDNDTMDVDPTTTKGERGVKRGAENDLQEGGKKFKKESPILPPKRDREHATVFISSLPEDVQENELVNLFKDCGTVREVKVTRFSGSSVATVEFTLKDNIPAALTKDKKRLRGSHEVAVHLAWQSTLYVTNFPESADDTSMRNLFGSYGTIFEIRWPSKKFKASRRFCYVQFTSPAAAQAALELHGRELEPGHTMDVLISNPERKKERTDHDANDREVYVAGLSRSTTKADLEVLFKIYGQVKEIRLAEDGHGKAKGFAFVEFENTQSATAALACNNHELKKRRISVTLADSRAKAKNRHAGPDTGLGRLAEIKSRSLRVRGLPEGTQEGLLQQFFEKIAQVKRVELFVDLREATVEFQSVAEAGKLLLRTEPFVFNNEVLKLTEEGAGPQAASPATARGLFIPRGAAGHRSRAGLGARKSAGSTKSAGSQAQYVAERAVAGSSSAEGSSSASASASTSNNPNNGRDQNDFRRMILGGT